LKQQDLQLAGVKGKTRLLILWPPGQAPLRETLTAQPKPLAIIDQDFYSCAQAIGKDKKRAAKRVFTQSLPTKRRQPIDAFAKIDRRNAEQQSVMGRDL